MRLRTVVRFTLVAALLYGVMTETGIWTTLALGYLLVKHEIDAEKKEREQDGVDFVKSRIVNLKDFKS